MFLQGMVVNSSVTTSNATLQVGIYLYCDVGDVGVVEDGDAVGSCGGDGFVVIMLRLEGPYLGHVITIALCAIFCQVHHQLLKVSLKQQRSYNRK